jgi:hypothetical protein
MRAGSADMGWAECPEIARNAPLGHINGVWVLGWGLFCCLHTAFAHLAPTIGLGRVPDLKPAPKGPVERVAGVFVGCGVCGVKNHFLATPHPSAKLKWPLNRATAARGPSCSLLPSLLASGLRQPANELRLEPLRV